MSRSNLPLTIFRWVFMHGAKEIVDRGIEKKLADRIPDSVYKDRCMQDMVALIY